MNSPKNDHGGNKIKIENGTQIWHKIQKSTSELEMQPT